MFSFKEVIAIQNIVFEVQITDIVPLNPQFSSCKVLIMYEGLNRNNSYISKVSAESMLPTLFNIPIVGEFNEAVDDFRGHGGKIEITDTGIKFIHTTKPYGLIPESTTVAWETITEKDGTEREYLTCTGYLWTGRYPEALKVIQEGSGQSMELADVQGKWVKSGKSSYFNIESAVFSALTILGKDVEPCFESASITAYRLNKEEYMNEFNKMINELKYTLNQSSQTDFNKIKKEGGDQVDEKLELFTKFPTLKDEDIAELKNNIEQYSLEDLETKLNELVEKQNQNPDTFALTAQQLQQEIRNSLYQERFIDRWGDSVRAYWYIDHDENRVYAEDSQNGYVPVGFEYSTNGDFVEINFTSKKRVKFVPQDMEGNMSSFAFVSVERKDFEIEKIKESTESEVTQKFESVQKELDEIKPEFEALKTQNEDLQNKVNEFSTSDHQSEIEQLKSNIEELTAYKLEREKQDKIDIVNKFTQLSDEDKKPFIDEIDKFSAEELEDKLFAEVGRKGISNFNKKPNEHLVFSLSDFKTTDPNQPAWAELVDQYKSKNKK